MIDAATFMMAGNAKFTLKRGEEHFTYTVSRAKKQPGQVTQPALWFVNLGISYGESVYIGLINDEGFRLTKASRVSMTSPSVKMFLDFLNQDDESISMMHVGRCCSCGRELTNPESIELGIGPECRGKVGV